MNSLILCFAVQLFDVIGPLQPYVETPAPTLISLRETRQYEGECPTLTELERRMPAYHIYRDQDRITWAHETTHGLNSNIRNYYRKPGFYVLDGKCVILNEPRCRLSDVAVLVPPKLRNHIYNTYLIQAQRDWEPNPSYILDEWVAYCNGAQARYELNLKSGVSEVTFMTQFNVFAIYLCMAANDPELDTFVKWNLKRTLKITYDNSTIGSIEEAKSLWNIVKSDLEFFSLREYCRTRFGKEWSETHLHFN